ncbi:MAG: hypothetical protein KF894_23830 [Labilithrix sp.]|nr:hypothetical protein [Labilithrix sp.]
MNPSTLADEFNFVFRKDAAAFLEALPAGVARRKSALPAWPGVVGPCAATATKKSKEYDWRHEVSAIYGTDAMAAIYRKAGRGGDLGFWNLRLVPHAYLVGKTYSGDPIVQVARGRHAGRVLLTNHESYHGFFEHLAALVPTDEQLEFFSETKRVWKKLGFTPSAITTDQIVDFLLHAGFDGAQVIAPSFAEFYAELGRVHGVITPRSSALPARATASRAPLTVKMVKRGTDSGTELKAAASNGKTAYFAGGNIIGAPLLMGTSDGKTFTTHKVPAKGCIEDIHADAKELWVCGDAAFLGRSTDGGRTFVRVKSDVLVAECPLWGVTKDERGVLWVTGSDAEDGIYLASSADGKTFRNLPFGGEVSSGRLKSSPHGVLIPTGSGRVWLGKGSSVTPTSLRAPHAITDVACAASGTLLAVDRKGNIHRSTNGGKTWKTGRAPKNRHSSFAFLDAIAELPDRRIIVGGQRGFILVSSDDGATFEELQHDHHEGDIVCILPFGDGLLVGTSDRAVLLVR